MILRNSFLILRSNTLPLIRYYNIFNTRIYLIIQVGQKVGIQFNIKKLIIQVQ